jgi:Asp-tRNA(Asn)/Glu-tRNA(Gln) amidotransferase A subunit family amidase
MRLIYEAVDLAQRLCFIREVRFIADVVAVLSAVVGIVPPGRNELNPDANAVQTLVAKRSDDGWRIALLQSTPAQYHGRPEARAALTAELRALLKN